MAASHINQPSGRAVTQSFHLPWSSVDAFKINDLVVKSKVREGEKTLWEEDIEDWMDEQDIVWFRGYAATWSKPDVAEEEVRPLWDEMEQALNGKKARIATPVALAFATKRS